MEQPNLSYIKELSGGQTEFEDKLIRVIKSEFPKEKETYYTNYQTKNYVLVAENVHKLKHKISILGLEKSYEIAVAFEANLLKGDTSLNKEFDAILEIITNYLQQL